jgi:hypothetical protein
MPKDTFESSMVRQTDLEDGPTKIERLVAALRPLAAIADAYDTNRLDECRPEWGEGELKDSQTILFEGRGGKTLLTLEDALRARAALKYQEPRR